MVLDDNGSLSRPLLEEDDIDNEDNGIVMESSNISIGTGSLQISGAVAEEDDDERSRGDHLRQLLSQHQYEKIPTIIVIVVPLFVLLVLLFISAALLPASPPSSDQSPSSLPFFNDDDPFCRITPNNDGSSNNKVLNIHIVPHTHDDVGWLKTVDQYYYGLNNTIQDANVSAILDSVLTSLSNPSTQHNKRTFTYVEMAFFSRWYATLSPDKIATLKELIANKQFTFTNGGWCMHDEANTHYIGMIDNTALGHRFLKEELDIVPTVGWQLDPFGHSATQGGLMTSGVGFDALYFGRIHHVDLKNRRNNAECEGLWSSSVSSSAATTLSTDESSTTNNPIFWGLTGEYGGNYGGPDGFCFDILRCNDNELLVNKSMDVIHERMKKFATEVAKQASETKGNNIMLTMGLDFFYSQAERNFANLDLLINKADAYFKEDIDAIKVFDGRFDKVNIFYSTPERYTRCKYVDSVHAAATTTGTTSHGGGGATISSMVDAKYNPATWKTNIKTKDFFPYADCDHCYWSGYFSSRQGLKRQERMSSSFLHASRQIESMLKLQSLQKRDDINDQNEEITLDMSVDNESTLWNASPLFTLEDASGTAQHHDAVAGTSKQHVAYDYSKQLAKGVEDANAFVTDGLRMLLLGSHRSPAPYRAAANILENLKYCHLLNETICDVSQNASRNGNNIMYIIVYNALASSRDEIVPLPVETLANYDVERLENDMTWSLVTSSVLPNHNYVKIPSAAPYTLFFNASNLHSLGATIFRVALVEEKLDRTVSAQLRRNMKTFDSSSNIRGMSEYKRYDSEVKDDLIVSNGILSVAFDSLTGTLKTITEEKVGGVSVGLTQVYGYYKSYSVNKPGETHHWWDAICHNKWFARFCKIVLKSQYLQCAPTFENDCDVSTQNGGAYIFRPTLDQTFVNIPPRSNPSMVVVHKRDLVTEVHAEFGEPAWIKQITRLIDGKDYVEVEYIIGPVPIDDGFGKEVVSKYSTTIRSDGVFYTDSNGRDFMKRIRGDQHVFGYDTQDYALGLEPVAENYFPVNTAMFIEDKSRSFTVLVDRSQGGSSLSDGSLELLIQRRLLYDDGRGVAEPLNETDSGITSCPPYGNSTRLGDGIIIKGVHRLMIGNNGASQARSQMDQVFSSPHIFVSSTPKNVHVPFHQPGLSMLKTSLPKNVMMLTFSVANEGNAFLVRLSHQYGVDEDHTYSTPASVNLHDLFPNHSIASITELTLSANQARAKWEKRRLRWMGNTDEVPKDDWKNVVELKPLEIRTFKILVKP